MFSVSRENPVPPRFGEEGTVVADAQVAVLAAEVDHLDLLLFEVVQPCQVVVDVDDLPLKAFDFKVRTVFDNDDLPDQWRAPK